MILVKTIDDVIKITINDVIKKQLMILLRILDNVINN